MEIVKLVAELLQLLKPNEAGQRRKNIRAFKRGRRRIYKDFKKDGFTQEELDALQKLDNAYVEMLLDLKKF